MTHVFHPFGTINIFRVLMHLKDKKIDRSRKNLLARQSSASYAVAGVWHGRGTGMLLPLVDALDRALNAGRASRGINTVYILGQKALSSFCLLF